MNERQRDRSWRLGNSACVLLSLLPVFGYAAFLFMGKRSGNKKYTKVGIVYGVLNVTAFTIGVFGIVYESLFYFLMVNVLLWPICFVHTLLFRGEYLQCLAFTQDHALPRIPLVYDRDWRRRNSLWRIWVYIPFLNALATYFMGRRLKKQNIKRFAVISAAIFLLLFFCVSADADVAVVKNLFTAMFFYMFYTYFMIHNLLSNYYLEDYLDATAELWLADTARYLCLADAAWRRRNSAWQILTWFPYVGVLGLWIVGIQQKNKRVIRAAGIFTLCYIISTLVSVIADRSQNALFVGMVKPVAFACILLSGVLVFFYGTLIYWDTLKVRADSLGGYDSEFARDFAAMQKQQDTQAPPDIQEEKLIDINCCSASELTTLPGVSLVDAKRAVDHRRVNGGFRSVDDFVDYLGIKPHFAVQIFRLATASQTEAAAKPPKEEKDPVGRVFDI